MQDASYNLLKQPRLKPGFTIVELLVVVVVIAILASITIVSYNGITKSARNSAIQSTLSQAVQKIELYRLNDTAALYPPSLSAAGLTSLIDSGDTAYVYAVSSDSKLFCLASSQAGRTYYITGLSLNPKPGICTNTTGTSGTGDVAIDGPSTVAVVATNYNVYNGAAPGTTQTVYSDGGGSLKIGNRFYTAEPTGIKITGVRIYNPASAVSGFLTLNVTAYVYLNDWVGSVLPGSTTFGQSPAATKVYSTPRTAGTWTDILFDSPVTLPAISSGSGTNDLATLAIQFAGGNHYVFITPEPSNSTQSTVRPGTYLAEDSSIGRGVASYNSGTIASTYGIDILYTPVTP